MKKRKLKRSILIIFSAVAILITSLAAASESLHFYLPVSMGMSGGGFGKLLNKLITKLGETTGNEITYTEEAYELGLNVNDMIYKQVKAGKADITYVNSLAYYEEKGKWDEIFVPAFTLIMNKTHYNEFCMYARKGSGIETVEGARGKIWGGMNTVPSRLILHENGIDEPLSSFFSDTKFLNESPVTNFVEAQSTGDIDIFTAIKSQVLASSGGGNVPGSGGENKSQGITFQEITCVEGDHGWIFGFHKKVPEDAMLKITKTMINANKDPAFSEFQFMFMAIKGKFAKFEPANLERTKEIAALKKKFGWDKEMKEHFKKAGK